MGITRIIAFSGLLAYFGGAVFVFVLHLRVKKMQKISSKLCEYIKEKDFLLVKNGGDDPCDTNNEIVMPLFSQESDYIIRRKDL